MIFTERTITVVNDSATINKPLILYRGDKNIELKITIAESQFKFRNTDASNVIETTDASYAQLVINTPYNSPIFSDVAVTKNGAVIFVITEAMIDEIREVGAYEIQIRLLDDNKQSRASIPPVSNAIEIREPIAIEDGSAVDSNAVNVAKVNRALTTTSAPLEAFDSQGNYIKKTWGDGDPITDAALNKMEAGIDGVNKKVGNNSSQIKEKANKDEIFSMANMGQDVKEAMTGGSVAVVGKNTILTENIVDGQVTMEKTSFIDVTRIVDLLPSERLLADNRSWNSVGWYEDSTDYYVMNTPIPVEYGENYIIFSNIEGNFKSINISRIMFKSVTSTVVGSEGYIGSKINVNSYITIPEGATYMFIQFYNGDEGALSKQEFLNSLCMVKGTEIPTQKLPTMDGVSIPYLDKKIKQIENNLQQNYKLINIFPQSIEIMENTQLNGLGWYEDYQGRFTIKTHIPVSEGETYSFALDDFPIKPVYVSIKKNDSLYDYDQSNLLTRAIYPEKITINSGGKYMFLTFDDVFKDDIARLVITNNCSSVTKISNALQNKKIMSLGDSLSEQGYWQNYMCGRLGAKDYLNLAIGGKKVFEFIENVNSANITDIDIVTVMGFFNNGSNIAGNINDEKSNDSTSSVCSQYKYIIEYLYNLKNDIRIILLTPHRPRANDVIDKVNIVKQIGQLYGIPVVDVYNNAGFNDITYDLYLADAVHSNREGYKKEAEYITAQVSHIYN